MRASIDRDGIRLGGLAGFVGILGWFGIFLAGIAGCSPATPPVAPAKPVAAAHADHDHDHDHGKDDSHDHGKKAGHDHDDHDDHTHPETLAAGVLELEAMWGHVKEALKAGDREKADDKVHAVGHLLEDFESLLAKEKAEAQEAGKKATEEVFDCFDKLDEAFHGEEDDLKNLDLDALGQRLEAAIKTLKEMATAGSK
jgi:ABC-type Zn2+ transport system substrate-binding protein/surface adhesin